MNLSALSWKSIKTRKELQMSEERWSQIVTQANAVDAEIAYRLIFFAVCLLASYLACDWLFERIRNRKKNRRVRI